MTLYRKIPVTRPLVVPLVNVGIITGMQFATANRILLGHHLLAARNVQLVLTACLTRHASIGNV